MNISEEKKSEMLKVVRNYLENRLFGKSNDISLDDKFYDNNFGLFVTLHKNGNLRGCIGLIEGIKPLRDGLIEMAEASAFEDRRFMPLEKDELEKIEIEISILSPLEKIDNWQNIIPGKHGVVISDGFRQAVFLPQVATEQNWDLETMLENLSLKAGLNSNGYKNENMEFKVFTANVFSENDFNN